MRREDKLIKEELEKKIEPVKIKLLKWEEFNNRLYGRNIVTIFFEYNCYNIYTFRFKIYWEGLIIFSEEYDMSMENFIFYVNDALKRINRISPLKKLSFINQ